MTDSTFGFSEFFEQGERMTDVVDVVAFAMVAEARGDLDGAMHMYRWASELLAETGEGAASDYDALRADIDDAILRLSALPSLRREHESPRGSRHASFESQSSESALP